MIFSGDSAATFSISTPPVLNEQPGHLLPSLSLPHESGLSPQWSPLRSLWQFFRLLQEIRPLYLLEQKHHSLSGSPWPDIHESSFHFLPTSKIKRSYYNAFYQPKKG